MKVSKEHEDMIVFLQDQILALHKKVRKQADQIEKYRVAISRIEEIIDET